MIYAFSALYLAGGIIYLDMMLAVEKINRGVIQIAIDSGREDLITPNPINGSLVMMAFAIAAWLPLGLWGVINSIIDKARRND